MRDSFEPSVAGAQWLTEFINRLEGRPADVARKLGIGDRTLRNAKNGGNVSTTTLEVLAKEISDQSSFPVSPNDIREVLKSVTPDSVFEKLKTSRLSENGGISRMLPDVLAAESRWVAFFESRIAPGRLCSFNGAKLPVVFYPALRKDRLNCEAAIRKPLIKKSVPNLNEFDSNYDTDCRRFWEELRERSSRNPDKLFNRLTYDMATLHLESGKSPSLECKLGTYFESRATSDVLETEMVLTLKGGNKELRIDDLPARRRLEGKLRGVGAHRFGEYRSSAIGITSIVVFQRGPSWCTFLSRRNAAGTEDYHDMLHVAPSGMFQPHFGDRFIEEEFDVKRGFFMEFFEELYRANDAMIGIDPSGIWSQRPVKLMADMLKKGSAQLFYLGVGVNLMKMRADICLLLLIKEPSWFANEVQMGEWPLRLSKEYHSASEGTLGRGVLSGNRDFIDLGKELKLPGSEVISSSKTVPMAAVVLNEGLKVAREEL